MILPGLCVGRDDSGLAVRFVDRFLTRYERVDLRRLRRNLLLRVAGVRLGRLDVADGLGGLLCLSHGNWGCARREYQHQQTCERRRQLCE